MNDARAKHLEFILATITRMNTNSFLLKGWALTLVSATLALAARALDSRYAIAACVAVPVFWGLDAFYLHQERKYRALYDAVRAGLVGDFDMNAAQYCRGWRAFWSCVFSRTVWPVYAAMLVVAVAATILPLASGAGATKRAHAVAGAPRSARAAQPRPASVAGHTTATPAEPPHSLTAGR